MQKTEFLNAIISSFIYINKVKDNTYLNKIEKLFEKYKFFLNEQNNTHNLTRLNDENSIYEQYFYESIIPFRKIDLNNKSLLDIGSGSGIPGIALKILFPTMNLTIIESNTKKINFMKQLCNHLNFDDVIFLNTRAETADHNLYETFDYVTSRAVANLKILLEISAPFAKLNGSIIEPKGINYENEYNQINPIMIDELGLKLIEIDKLKLNSHQINTFVFGKIKKTSSKYPRTWKEIINE